MGGVAATGLGVGVCAEAVWAIRNRKRRGVVQPSHLGFIPVSPFWQSCVAQLPRYRERGVGAKAWYKHFRGDANALVDMTGRKVREVVAVQLRRGSFDGLRTGSSPSA
jgi:hypothetical protein